ncbi:uncharacterized, partial [Tachysurus ichikawai]
MEHLGCLWNSSCSVEQCSEARGSGNTVERSG